MRPRPIMRLLSPSTILVVCAALTVWPSGSDVAMAAPAGSLDRLVTTLDAGLGRGLQGQRLGRLDLAVMLRPGPEVTPELVHTTLGLLLGKLSGRGFRRVVRAQLGSDATQRRRRARQQGYELLLDLEIAVLEGHLHLRGLLMQTDRQLWRDTVLPERGARSHLHASVRIDAEVRSYLGTASSSVIRFSPQTYATGYAHALAMSTGDLDGDGRIELVLLSPRVIRVLAFKGRTGGFVAVRSVELTPPWASPRPRRPVGTLVVADLDGKGRASVLARTSEMERGGRYALAGKQLRRERDIEGYPVALLEQPKSSVPLLCQGVSGRDLLEPGCLSPMMSGNPPGGPFYNLKAETISGPRGKPQRILGLVDRAGHLQLLSDGQPVALAGLSAVGLAFELVDLDDDGTMEVVTTGAGGPEEKDRLTVFRLSDGVLRLLWRSAELPGTVSALAHGDIDGDGRVELVAAVEHGVDRTVTLMVVN